MDKCFKLTTTWRSQRNKNNRGLSEVNLEEILTHTRKLRKIVSHLKISDMKYIAQNSDMTKQLDKAVA